MTKLALLRTTALVLVTGAVIVSADAALGAERLGANGSYPPRAAAALAGQDSARTDSLARGVTLLVTPDGTIPRYRVPGGPQTGTVPATWHQAPSTLPVIAARNGWFDVRLAQRPNESTAWVRAENVTVSSTPYAIVVNLKTTHLTVYHYGLKVYSFPAGVGSPIHPTPTGHFFIAFIAGPPTPAYGAFVLVTSAHSDSITDWEMSGDAMIAIHGPLGSDTLIGTRGAHISHGCIRLHEPDLLRLRNLPAGTPVTIVAR